MNSMVSIRPLLTSLLESLPFFTKVVNISMIASLAFVVLNVHEAIGVVLDRNELSPNIGISAEFIPSEKKLISVAWILHVFSSHTRLDFALKLFIAQGRHVVRDDLAGSQQEN
jgi:hypothetical protein